MTDHSANNRLTVLFQSHYDEVLAYCARRIGRSEAEDAAAEVFSTAIRRVDEIDWTTVRPWLYGIARGVLANRWRSLYRRRRLFRLVAGLAEPPVDRPDELVLRRAEEGEVIKVLQRMKPRDREVLMLAAWEELTGSEIAGALGISLAAAEQRLHRAKHRFARTLQPQSSPARPAGLTLNDEEGA
jgi:RNA polymerase sigma factor (sigma-70 family)